MMQNRYIHTESDVAGTREAAAEVRNNPLIRQDQHNRERTRWQRQAAAGSGKCFVTAKTSGRLCSGSRQDFRCCSVSVETSNELRTYVHFRQTAPKGHTMLLTSSATQYLSFGKALRMFDSRRKFDSTKFRQSFHDRVRDFSQFLVSRFSLMPP